MNTTCIGSVAPSRLQVCSQAEIYDVPEVTFTPSYDAYGRITRRLVERAVNSIVDLGDDYDSNGSITQQTLDHRYQDPAHSYSYDGLDRLTRGNYLDDPCDNEQFVYDPPVMPQCLLPCAFSNTVKIGNKQ